MEKILAIKEEMISEIKEALQESNEALNHAYKILQENKILKSENEELNKQIEKMKMFIINHPSIRGCGCKHEINTDVDPCKSCINFENWELAE